MIMLTINVAKLPTSNDAFNESQLHHLIKSYIINKKDGIIPSPN